MDMDPVLALLAVLPWLALLGMFIEDHSDDPLIRALARCWEWIRDQVARIPGVAAVDRWVNR